jgi:pantoate--beta-alanine ligase
VKVISTPLAMRAWADLVKKKNQSLGFVPTMGALHAGHASLIYRAKKENDKVVVSIFVNPAQFGPHEDFSRYPRPFEEDRKLCASLGVDALYHPSPEDIYPQGYRTYVNVEGLSDLWCGRFRPGHFRGVATVVLKLLQTTFADRAYFGEKDYQQFMIIRRMIQDLNLPQRIIGCPTLREKDGLALSSRNQYLSPIERAQAAILYRSLNTAAKKIKSGETVSRALSSARRNILSVPRSKIDYIALIDGESLEELKIPRPGARIISAVWIGKTRLIDNIKLV